MNQPHIAIIGAGKVGTVFATLLSAQGYSVSEVMSRTRASAERLAQRVGARVAHTPRELTAEIIVITASDRAIGEIADQLAIPALTGRVVLHTSGATTLAPLTSAGQAGLHIGSIHPLFSFGRVNLSLDDLRDTYYAIDGDRSAREAASAIALALGGKVFTLPADKRALYHASAVCASNYLVTLLLTAARQLMPCGLSEDDALHALLPLAQGTLESLAHVGSQALTGPIARGDTITVDQHLRALGEGAPDRLTLYRQLGMMTADIARDTGQLPVETHTAIHHLLRRDIHEPTR